MPAAVMPASVLAKLKNAAKTVIKRKRKYNQN